jgi:hypothetical protein
MENYTTALINAAYNGHVYIVEFLVINKRVWRKRQRYGKWLLPLVRRRPAGARPCRAMPLKGFSLYAAAQQGHEHVVQCLLKEFGTDVNIATISGSIPLMAAAE